MRERKIEASPLGGHRTSGVLQSQDEAVPLGLHLPDEQQKDTVHLLHGRFTAANSGRSVFLEFRSLCFVADVQMFSGFLSNHITAF